MSIQFNSIPKDHPSYTPEKRLFRFHSGDDIFTAVASAVEVTDVKSVEDLIHQRGLDFKEVVIQPYTYDTRVSWLTYLVTIDGQAVGYTNHSLED